MTAPDPVLLSTLPKGHRFPDTSFELTAQSVARYIEAVQDANGIYIERGLAPPLAIAAFALGVLLETMQLPDGALHTSQEIEVRQSVPIESALTLSGRVAQRSERAGMLISVLEFEVALAGSRSAALVGRTTVLAPKAEAATT